MEESEFSNFVLSTSCKDINYRPRKRAQSIVDRVAARPLWVLDQQECRDVVLACSHLGVLIESMSSLRLGQVLPWLESRHSFRRPTQLMLADGAILGLAANMDLRMPDLQACPALAQVACFVPAAASVRPGSDPVIRPSEARRLRTLRR